MVDLARIVILRPRQIKRHRPEDSLDSGEKARRVPDKIGEDEFETRAVILCKHVKCFAVALEPALCGANMDVHH